MSAKRSNRGCASAAADSRGLSPSRLSSGGEAASLAAAARTVARQSSNALAFVSRTYSHHSSISEVEIFCMECQHLEATSAFICGGEWGSIREDGCSYRLRKAYVVIQSCCLPFGWIIIHERTQYGCSLAVLDHRFGQKNIGPTNVAAVSS